MQLGIDASNLRSGGSVTHLSELLRVAQPEKHGITRVFVWGGRNILDHLPEREWLECIHETALDAPLPMRVWWQQTKLSRLAKKAACDLLFIPGGTYLGDFRPYVTMSRNVLPFDFSQVRHYGASVMLPRFLLLRFSQAQTIRQAAGTIFLNDYARALVVETVEKLNGTDVTIPHGVAERFRATPRAQKKLSAYSQEEPFKLLYVSTIDAYKHQWHVVEAVSKLIGKGIPVTLELVGHAHAPSLRRLRKVVRRLNAAGYVHYRGTIPHAELPDVYARSDAFIFASSCENLPNTLLEAMTAGLPIACSNKSPMPEILGDGGVYFDPEDPAKIASALHELIVSPDAREKYAAAASERVRPYTWERCADETFSFLRKITCAHASGARSTVKGLAGK